MDIQPQVLSLFGTTALDQHFHLEGQPSFLFLNQVHWFVPCTLYQCEIPLERPYQSNLNCFESAVLGLLALSHRNVDKLAEMLCFPDPSFVRLLLSDLQDRLYIDAHLHLTPFGKEEMKKATEQSLEHESTMGTFFQNQLTGTLLPYIHIPHSPEDSIEKKLTSCTLHTLKPANANPEKDNKNPASSVAFSPSPTRKRGKKPPKELSFSSGSTGQKEVMRGSVLSPPTSEPHLSPPPRDAAKLLREYKQYTKNTSHSSDNGSNWEISAQYLGNTLHLTPLYQTCYFHLQGGKVDGDADTFLISDGFLPSLVDMVHYMEEHESQRVQLFHESAIVARRLEEESNEYENQLYPQLQGRWLPSLSSFDGTKDTEKALEATIRRGVIEMYGELEWALHYYFQKHPFSPHLLDDYRGRTPSKNRVLLASILEKTNLTQGDVDLISQFYGKVNFTKGTPTMTTLIPLLLISWDKGESTLLSLLCQRFPDFYRTLSYLHPIRNKAIHTGVATLSLREFSLYQDFASGFLDTLLPDWQKRRFIKKQVNENNSDTNRRLIAMQHLSREFGFSYVKHHLTTEMKETLLQLAPENRQPPTPLEYIKGLCLLLELSFAQALEVLAPSALFLNHLDTQTRDKEKTQTAADLKEREGLEDLEIWHLLNDLKDSNKVQDPTLLTTTLVKKLETRHQITLPPSLVTVKQSSLETALLGAPSTLGAEVLAFLYLDTSGIGEYLLQNQALKVIQTIISLRGHGNTHEVSSLLLGKEDLEGLRHCVVSIMKGLVTYGKRQE